MRDKFVGLPMTEEVIRKRNSLEVIQSLTFCYKDIEAGDEEPDLNGLDDQNPDQVLDGRGLHILNDVPVCIEVKRYVFVVDRVKLYRARLIRSLSILLANRLWLLVDWNLNDTLL